MSAVVCTKVACEHLTSHKRVAMHVAVWFAILTLKNLASYIWLSVNIAG